MEVDFLNLPILTKFKLTEKNHVLAELCVNYFMDAKTDVVKFNAYLDRAYDITEKIDINAKYSFGFWDVAFNGIFIGANYFL